MADDELQAALRQLRLAAEARASSADTAHQQHQQQRMGGSAGVEPPRDGGGGGPWGQPPPPPPGGGDAVYGGMGLWGPGAKEREDGEAWGRAHSPPH